VLALGAAGCSATGGTAGREAPAESAGATASSLPRSDGALVYVSLGDSWPEGAHCNGCRTFPQTHAEALQEKLGEPVILVDLAGQAQPFFTTRGGGGSAGLLEALRTEESFREEVAKGDIIVIATGPNDGGEIFESILAGTCGGKDDTRCVMPLARRWRREFDAILDEIETLRDGRATAIRLVNAANAFNDPASGAAALRGFEAYFEALTDALCAAARAHNAVCVDVRPTLNGPGFEQPVNDSSQESMDAVAQLLLRTGVPELE
jgi:hypothetical protein